MFLCDRENALNLKSVLERDFILWVNVVFEDGLYLGEGENGWLGLGLGQFGVDDDDSLALVLLALDFA